MGTTRRDNMLPQFEKHNSSIIDWDLRLGLIWFGFEKLTRMRKARIEDYEQKKDSNAIRGMLL